jgi:hypothetical protein
MRKTKKSKEDYKENYNDSNGGGSTITTSIMGLFWTAVMLLAVFYSFKIKGGFDFGHFLLAFFFSPIYLIWGISK